LSCSPVSTSWRVSTRAERGRWCKLSTWPPRPRRRANPREPLPLRSLHLQPCSLWRCLCFCASRGDHAEQVV